VCAQQDAEGKKYYWLHSLSLTILTGFGGGIIAPMMINKPPLIFQNDLIVPFCVLFWYLCNTVPLVQQMLMSTPGKLVWGLFNGLFRTHTVCNIVKMAHETLPAGAFYPHPLVGPIIAGTLLGGGSNFMPLNKGLDPLKNGTPWTLQGAFMTATAFSLGVCDKTGWIGIGFRSVFGTYSEETMRSVIATIHITTILAQVLFDESANFFTPVHKLLYIVFHANGPTAVDQKPDTTIGWDWKTRVSLERCIEAGRVILVVAVIMTHIFISFPSSHLVPGMGIAPGEHIGLCHMPSLVKCAPTSLSFYSTTSGFKLAAYKGHTMTSPPAPAALSWSVDISAKLSSDEKASMALGEDGVLRVVASTAGSKSERQLWASKSGCKTKGKGMVKLTLVNALPVVMCPNDETIKLA